MRYCFVVFVSVLLGNAVFAQSIQKMKAEELHTYISKSDKPLIVSFWATWCASCNEEIPYFISTIKDKYKGEVELLLVSLDIKSYYPAKIAAFASKKNYETSIVWLNETNADVFCPLIDARWSGAIPSTLMVNNKKQYRKFYETGITPSQFVRDVNEMVNGGENH